MADYTLSLTPMEDLALRYELEQHNQDRVQRQQEPWSLHDLLQSRVTALLHGTVSQLTQWLTPIEQLLRGASDEQVTQLLATVHSEVVRQYVRDLRHL